MGGDIKVDSVVGKGSSFAATFKKYEGKSTETLDINVDKMKEFKEKS